MTTLESILTERIAKRIKGLVDEDLRYATAARMVQRARGLDTLEEFTAQITGEEIREKLSLVVHTNAFNPSYFDTMYATMGEGAPLVTIPFVFVFSL